VVYRLALLFVLAFASLAAAADEDPNVQVVRTMMDLINQRDLDSLHTVVAESVVRHSDATPEVVVTNLDEFKAFLETDFAAVPDSIQEIDFIFGAGDKVAVRARYGGTQTGPMGPFAATGKTFSLIFIGIARIEDGKVAEIWVEWDNLSALGQLGLLPPPPPPPAD